ncbi:ribonuclease HII [Filobacillus milosensis]|uniref:Ribonuclease HII n=1 Tax=Filobacillus milosensis TaxID=94137 RepID=A0A4Y8IRC7_9BACI|nr:ribonuclease HII [Filobacillus milosensis]TFB23228.1 ribonuclease HII [Filobacillus milosensis]
MTKKETIAVIKKTLEEDQFSTNWFNRIIEDERKGVQQLIKKYSQEKEKETILHEQFIKMSELETALHYKGYQFISGIDEVGRGPLAGPVVAASVILPKDFYLPGLNDSKKLSHEQKEKFYRIIQEEALAVGVGEASAKEIDYYNIYQATKLAMTRSIESLNQKPDYLLIDAMSLENISIEQESIIKGDSKSISIAAASVIAKVTRDQWMAKIGEQYPMYQFENNSGYGTRAHLKALEEHGPTPYHRRSFEPVRQYT